MKPGNLTPRLYFLRKTRELRKLGATKEDLKKICEVRKQCLRYLQIAKDKANGIENYQGISVALRCENKELFKGENSAKT